MGDLTANEYNDKVYNGDHSGNTVIKDSGNSFEWNKDSKNEYNKDSKNTDISDSGNEVTKSFNDNEANKE